VEPLSFGGFCDNNWTVCIFYKLVLISCVVSRLQRGRFRGQAVDRRYLWVLQPSMSVLARVRGNVSCSVSLNILWSSGLTGLW